MTILSPPNDRNFRLRDHEYHNCGRRIHEHHKNAFSLSEITVEEKSVIF